MWDVYSGGHGRTLKQNKPEKSEIPDSPPKHKQNLTKDELALAKEIYRDLGKSVPHPRTPELIYLGFLKNLQNRAGLENDLSELKGMIYSVAKKMAQIEEKSASIHGEPQRRLYSSLNKKGR